MIKFLRRLSGHRLFRPARPRTRTGPSVEPLEHRLCMHHSLPLGIDNEHIQLGTFQLGVWQVDANGTGAWDGAAGGDLAVAAFGTVGDTPVVGDWNGDGSADMGVYRDGAAPRFLLDLNGNHTFDTGVDAEIPFGQPGARPVVGDWDGDGWTDFGVRELNTFYLYRNAGGVLGSFQGMFRFKNYRSGDVPISGDWNGDGLWDVGVFRGRKFFVDLDGDRIWDGKTLDGKFGGWGGGSGVPVVGDWNEDGVTDLGVYSAGDFLLDALGDWDYGGPAAGDVGFSYGAPDAYPVMLLAGAHCIEHTGLARHIHAHLSIVVEGISYPLDANIGITQGCMLPVHTHDTSGTIHMEDTVNRNFHLGELFENWGKEFNAQQFDVYVVDATHALTMTVNGVSSFAFEDLVLSDGDQVVIQYG